jgi:hypothetical protein
MAVNESWARSQLAIKQAAGTWNPATKPINPLTEMAWQAGLPLYRTDMFQTTV